MARIARNNTRRFGSPIVRADALALPFPDRNFDSIVLTFPTPIIAKPSLWQEMARVLRPGGQVVVVVGAKSRSRVWPRLLEALIARATGACSATRHPDDTPPAEPAEREATWLDPRVVGNRFAVRHLRLSTEHGEVWLLTSTLKPGPTR
jgi:SAM-dependent methyltransferase